MGIIMKNLKVQRKKYGDITYTHSEPEMSFEEYQQKASRTDNLRDDKTLNILNACMGMVGESAETLEHVKKAMFQGHELDPAKLIDEAGDTLWYIAKLARVLGTSLEEIAKFNIAKLEKRYPELEFSEQRSVNRNE